MIYHVYANQSNVGDWLSALGIQSLLAPHPVQDLFCDQPFVARTIEVLQGAGPEDFVIIGGGGLFMDYFTGFWRAFEPIAARVPFAIWGAGACDLKREASRPPAELVSAIVRQSRLCVVRDELTRELLHEVALPPPVICPAIVSVRTAPPSECPSLLHVDHYDSVGAENFGMMVAAATVFGERTGRRVTKTNNLIRPGARGELESVMRLYADADLVLSSRLHGCILALATGRRVLAVSGDYKIEAFMRAAGLTEWVVPLADIETVAERLASLPEQPWPTAFVAEGRRQNRAVAEQILALAGEPALRATA